MLSAYVELYLRDRGRRQELAPSSVVVIRSTLGTFCRHVRQRAPWLLTTRDVDTWIEPHYTRPNTAKSMLTKLRPFVKWLIVEDVITRDFTVGVRTPKPITGPARCLEPDDVRAVLEQCPDARARFVVQMMLYTGARVGEVARLRAEDVSAHRREAAIRGKGGRGQITRTVPVPAVVAAALREYLAEHPHPGAGPLVRSYQPPFGAMQPQSWSKLVARWFNAAGVNESAHSLRHTSAQDLIDEGADWRMIQDLLGHASIATTIDIYGRRRPTGLRDVMERRRYA